MGALFIGKSSMKEADEKSKKTKAPEIEPEPEIEVSS